MKKLLSWILVIALVLPTIGLTGYGIYLGTTVREWEYDSFGCVFTDWPPHFESTEEMLDYLTEHPAFSEEAPWTADFVPVPNTPIGYEMTGCAIASAAVGYSFSQIGSPALNENGKVSGSDNISVWFYFEEDASALSEGDIVWQTTSLIRGVPVSVADVAEHTTLKGSYTARNYLMKSGKMTIRLRMEKDSFLFGDYLAGEMLNFRRVPLAAAEKYGKNALYFPWATFFGEIHLFLFPLYAAIAFGVGWLIVPFAKRKKKKTPVE